MTLTSSRPAWPALQSNDVETIFNVMVLIGCALVLLAAFVFSPGEHGLSLFGFRWPFGCRLYETFGIRCSLCGMSRSFCSLAHGDMAAAFRFHRLGPALFVLFCLEVLYRLYALATGTQPVHQKLKRLHVGIVLTACAALLLNWLSYLGGLAL